MQRSPTLSPFVLLLAGLLSACGLAWAIHAGSKPVNWAERAQQLHEEAGDLMGKGLIDEARVRYADAMEAATRHLEKDPDNPEVLWLRQDASSRLEMYQRALADITRALELDAANPQFISRKAGLLHLLGRHDEAVRFLDEQIEANPRSRFLSIRAAESRIRHLEYLETRLIAELESNHPDRLHVRETLARHLRSPTPDSRARRLLTDAIATFQLRRDIDIWLERAWELVRESDELLGDVRTWSPPTPSVSRARAAVDRRLGRLILAKEELESAALDRSLPKSATLGVLQDLDQVLEDLDAHVARDRLWQRRIELAGESAAGAWTTDAIEVGYLAATVDPSRREAWLERADRRLEETQGGDIRTLAWRGLADIEWEPADPQAAIERLGAVYEMMRVSARLRDPLLLVPKRARRIMQGLVNAYHEARRFDRALQVANSLLEFSPDDPELRRQRARIFRSMRRFPDAAADLLAAMKHAPRDRALFDEWLAVANEIRGPRGQSPEEAAVAAAERYRTQLAEFQQELERGLRSLAEIDPRDINQLQAERRRLRAAQTNLSVFRESISNDPVIAWHMSEQFGRYGRAEIAYDLLVRAVWSEPDVPWFRFRLGQLLLDMGRPEPAAAEFEAVLEHSPDDAEAALYAYDAYRQLGDLERARRIRNRVMREDPQAGGLKFVIREALDRGDYDSARLMLAPHLQSGDPVIQRWFADVQIHMGNFETALRYLDMSRRGDPTSAETGLLIAVSQALLGDLQAFEQATVDFLSLPRLLPRVRIEQELDRLERNGRFGESARLAIGAAGRFGEGEELILLSRGSLDALRAGDPNPLRALIDDLGWIDRLPEDVVRAGFALRLRENGMAVAADWFDLVDENALDRTRRVDHLTHAAASILSNQPVNAEADLLRYERIHERGGIPAADAAVWWILRQRVPHPEGFVPAIASGAEAEIDWLRSGAVHTALRDGTVGEAYLRLQLARFLGRFDDDERIRALSQEILDLDPRAMFAARVLAEAIERAQGREAAAFALLSRYQQSPTDYPTFERIAELLRESKGPGTARMLDALGKAGMSLFPDFDAPYLAAARAAVLSRRLAGVERLVEPVLARDPLHPEALSLLASAGPALEPATAKRLARVLAEDRNRHDTLTGETRAFLVERYSAPERYEEARDYLAPVVEADPSFYEGTALLIEALVEDRRGHRVDGLIDRLTESLLADEDVYADEAALIDLAVRLARLERPDAALRVVDAALLGAPNSIRLRLRRTALLSELSRGAEVVDDLALLCAISPRNKDIQFDFGDAILTERTGQARIVLHLLEGMEESDAEDPRYHVLRGRLAYAADDLASAAASMASAADRAPEVPRYQYLSALYALLSGDGEQAARALARIPDDFEFGERVKWMRRMAR